MKRLGFDPLISLLFNDRKLTMVQDVVRADASVNPTVDVAADTLFKGIEISTCVAVPVSSMPVLEIA
jgi:hypothetical protein